MLPKQGIGIDNGESAIKKTNQKSRCGLMGCLAIMNLFKVFGLEVSLN